ncbi:MAG: hypothetical protein EOO61_22085 [Hymenobacter sp.]|nr:MAG: hypothetical protein EOO61_22085 [Hymenobacter sp.]
MSTTGSAVGVESHLLLLHDGTEQEVPGPVEAEAPQKKYSGKKYTVKNAATTLPYTTYCLPALTATVGCIIKK